MKTPASRQVPGGIAALEQRGVGEVIDALAQTKGAGMDLLSKPLQEVPGLLNDFIGSPAYANEAGSSQYSG
ncbi:MAG: hypothetical protein JSR47_21955 [Proteobacteria bacterium]|nr:hypothetical protein [Pseudomonadota bacterium]